MKETIPKDTLKGHIKNARDKAKTKLDKLANKERLKKLINEERLAKSTNKKIVDGLIYQVNKYKKDKVLFFFMEKLIDNDLIEVNNNPRFIKLIEKLEKEDKKANESVGCNASVVTDTTDSIVDSIQYEYNTSCRSANNTMGEIIVENKPMNGPNNVIKVQDVINYIIDHTTFYQKGSIDLH